MWPQANSRTGCSNGSPSRSKYFESARRIRRSPTRLLARSLYSEGETSLIHSKIKTTVKGQGNVEQIRKMMAVMNKSYVIIGITEDSGSYVGEGSDHPEVVQVALWMEFGTDKVDARSFVGSTIDEHVSLLNNWREESLEKIARGIWDVEKALESIGARIQILIQNKIKSNVPPPLSDKYAEQKTKEGLAAVTLIRTGVLLRSVTYKVFMK